jgi:hypothetical protein
MAPNLRNYTSTYSLAGTCPHDLSRRQTFSVQRTNKSNFRKQKQKKISGQQQQQLKCMRIAAAFTHKEDSTK